MLQTFPRCSKVSHVARVLSSSTPALSPEVQPAQNEPPQNHKVTSSEPFAVGLPLPRASQAVPGCPSTLRQEKTPGQSNLELPQLFRCEDNLQSCPHSLALLEQHSERTLLWRKPRAGHCCCSLLQHDLV